MSASSENVQATNIFSMAEDTAWKTIACLFRTRGAELPGQREQRRGLSHARGHGGGLPSGRREKGWFLLVPALVSGTEGMAVPLTLTL